MNRRCMRRVAALAVLLVIPSFDSASFQFRRNSAPVVACVVSKDTIVEGETIAIRASAVDPNGDPLTYAWSASGGKISGSGGQARFDATGLAPGRYTITVTVSDQKHQTSCSADVTAVKKNHSPTVSCEPAVKILQGGSVTLNASASDPDNDHLSYQWEIDGERLAAADPQITFGAEGRKPGTYNVRVRVGDGEATATCSTPVTVQQKTVPVIECLTTTMDVASGESIELRVKGTNPDGGKLRYAWASNGGTVRGLGESGIFNASGVKAGTYTVTATALDSHGGKASCRMMVNVSERMTLVRDNCGYFAPAGTRVDSCVNPILNDLAVRMKKDPKLHANIIGYTDLSGERSSRRLGEERAEAVATYLEQQGVEASHLMITNGGMNNPASRRKTAAGERLNRRVEIELWGG